MKARSRSDILFRSTPWMLTLTNSFYRASRCVLCAGVWCNDSWLQRPFPPTELWSMVQPVVPLHVTPVSLGVKAFLMFLCFLMSPPQSCTLITSDWRSDFYQLFSFIMAPWMAPLLRYSKCCSSPLFCQPPSSSRDAGILKSSWGDLGHGSLHVIPLPAALPIVWGDSQLKQLDRSLLSIN